MAIRFNADEVLKIAERTEKNAAKFYRRAAELHDKENVQFLLRMAAMEDDHKVTFAKMRAGLTDAEKRPTVYDPMDENLLYLKTMADLHGGEGDPEVTASLTGRESLEQIILKAIELEKKAILFYFGLEGLVPPELGQTQIERIIAEEKSHVVILSRELNEIRKVK
jgi:rubrerythrin